MRLIKALVKNNKFLITIFFSLIISSCGSYTKEEYLTDYENFTTDIKNNWQSYDDDDWTNKELDNEEFYIKEYKKFSAELKPSEMLKVQRLNFVYHFYKGDIVSFP